MKCDVLSPVKHDGKKFAVGDSIELTDAQAKALADVGAIGKAGKTETEPKAERKAEPKDHKPAKG